MKKLLLPVVLLIGLGACQGGKITPAETALTGCDTFASALVTLSALRAQGKLSDGKISLVDKTRAYVDPFCLGDAPDIDASAIDLTVNAGVSVLQSVILGD